MKKISNLLVSSKNKKIQYMWFISGGIAFSGTAFVFQMLVSRTLGAGTAGDFSIAYSISQLALTVGLFGMRTYQVSDLKEKFSFGDYWWSRIISLFFMFGYVLLKISLSGYSEAKVEVILLMSVYRAFDVIADVYQGYFQQHGNLGDAGRTVTVKAIISVISFVVVLHVSNNLLWALCAACVAAGSLFAIMEINIIKLYEGIAYKFDFHKVKSLIFECIPLCLSTFLNIYILSVPKFSIDKYINSKVQAVYAIFYAVFMALNLCAGVILKPLLKRFSELWQGGYVVQLNRWVLKLFLIGIIISLPAGFIIYAYASDILGMIYGMDIRDYRLELLFMYIAGIINMGVTLYNYLFTVIRKQAPMLVCYGVVAVLALFISDNGTRLGGIRGCTISNIIIEMLMLIMLAMLYVVILSGEGKKKNEILGE